MEDFAAALESFDREQAAEAAALAFDDNIVTGTVIKLTDKHVVVDVGLKSEGLIPLEQVSGPYRTAQAEGRATRSRWWSSARSLKADIC